MKKLASSAIALAFVLLAAGNSFAADSDRARDNKDRDKNRATWKMNEQTVDSTRLVGMRVQTPDGKDAGEIDRFMVNTKDGRVSHAVIGVGGLAGVGERKVVVPWSQLKMARDAKDRDKMVVTIDRAALDRAPRYDAIRDRDDNRGAASPATDRDRDGVRDRADKAPNNPKKN
jgi:sporulation protein YlmC with PRC-barrel domain